MEKKAINEIRNGFSDESGLGYPDARKSMEYAGQYSLQSNGKKQRAARTERSDLTILPGTRADVCRIGRKKRKEEGMYIFKPYGSS